MSRFQGFPIGRYPIIIPAAGEDHSEYSEIGRKDTVNNEDEEQDSLVQNYDVSPLFTSKYISGGMGHLNFMERIQ